VSKYFHDDLGGFNTGDDPDITSTFTAGFYVDIKYPLQPSPHGAYFWCAHVIEARFSAEVWSVASAGWVFLRLPRLTGMAAP
jgi:hypothetical protein